MGVGGAFIMPATLSIITNVFPPEERGRAIGLWAGIAGVATALGPISGGFLLEHFYWGSVFTVNLPIVALALGATVVLIPNSFDPSRPRQDPVGAVLSIAGLVALLYGIIEAPERGWTDGGILTAFAVGIVILGVFALWERASSHPMLDVRFFRNPRFTAASLGITSVFFAMFGATFLLTQHLQFVMGYSPLQAGVRLLPWAAVMLVVAPSSARLVERFGTKAVVTTGLTLVTVALTLLSQLPVDSTYPGDVLWRMMIMAAGMALVMAPATESIMGSLPRAKAGVGSAVNDTTRQVGGALGVAIVGSVMSSIYRGDMGDVLAGSPLSPDAAEQARASLGGALGVAGSIGGDTGRLIADAAKESFVAGLHRGVLVASGAALVGAIVVFLWLPAHAAPAPEEPGAALPDAGSRAPDDALAEVR
jgi:EmrB/QacA subfamily drug resistance transporter